MKNTKQNSNPVTIIYSNTYENPAGYTPLIEFDKNGNLISGEPHLKQCVKLGAPIKACVRVGLDILDAWNLNPDIKAYVKESK